MQESFIIKGAFLDLQKHLYRLTYLLYKCMHQLNVNMIEEINNNYMLACPFSCQQLTCHIMIVNFSMNSSKALIAQWIRLQTFNKHIGYMVLLCWRSGFDSKSRCYYFLIFLFNIILALFNTNF